jgi:hypothetical protein
MYTKSKIMQISRTAVLIALIIVWQAVSAQFGNTIVTGSGVNLILIVSAAVAGLPSALAVACVSPFMARLFGIGVTFWALIPFVALGNAAIVLVWHFLTRVARFKNVYFSYIISLILGAAFKFAVLYLGIVVFAVPVILRLPEKQAAAISVVFSYPQLVTASIGGAVACAVLPLLTRALKTNEATEVSSDN